MTPPHWTQSMANEITREKIILNRLSYSDEDIFGLKEPFTELQLKKRRSELLKAYHSDRNHNLNSALKSILDKRIIEINSAYSALLESAVAKINQQSKNNAKVKEKRSGVEQRKEDEFDELLKKGVAKENRERVKVRKKR